MFLREKVKQLAATNNNSQLCYRFRSSSHHLPAISAGSSSSACLRKKMSVTGLVLAHSLFLSPLPTLPLQRSRPEFFFCARYKPSPKESRKVSAANYSTSLRSISLQKNRIRSFYPPYAGNSDASTSGETSDVNNTDGMLGDRNGADDSANILLAKLAILVGIAAAITVISIGFEWHTQGSIPGVPVLLHGSSVTDPAYPSGFTLKIFKYQLILPEYTPGWIYFWLLMAAGCGLFVSEEALNIWVGISLARTLSLDGTWRLLAESFSRNATYIISTVLWVYWGVCISDMVPFYFGKLFRQTGASDNVYSKLGIDKEKALSITRSVQRYGNLIGFVERFSLGVRNPTGFLAGVLGISSECYFAGVCCGGLITLPIQLGIGFLLKENPVVAFASVATAVGVWTVFPYGIAALTALFVFLRRFYSK